MNGVYSMVKSYRRRYKGTVAWRVKAHSKIIEKHLDV